MARNGDIGENALFIMAKQEIPKGFSLLGIYLFYPNILNFY